MDFKRGARLAAQLPAQSRVALKVSPSNQWDWQEVLLNHIWHELRVLQWQKTEDATKRNPKDYPEIFVPDFLEELKPKKEKEAEAHDLDEIKAILSRPRQGGTLKANEQQG